MVSHLLPQILESFTTIKKTNFVCMHCEIPDSLPWHYEQYSNTCTVDNFMTIMLLYARQNPTFLSKFGASEVEIT